MQRGGAKSALEQECVCVCVVERERENAYVSVSSQSHEGRSLINISLLVTQ